MVTLTKEQIAAVVEWMNEWEILKGTAVPIRFREHFSESTSGIVRTTCVRCDAVVLADRYKSVYCDRCIDDWININEEL